MNMTRRSLHTALCMCVLILPCMAFPTMAQEPYNVSLERVPDGGIQPQVAVGADGTLHLLYFKGDPKAGDLFYCKRAKGADAWSTPIQVNSQPGSAVAAGNMRGGQIALGRNDRVHVVWNGSSKAWPKVQLPSGEAEHNAHFATPMLYARIAEQAKAFEPQRNLMRRTFVLDGGGSVAADDAGNVTVVWHANLLGGPGGEVGRRVFVARSKDQGKTFAQEVAVSEKQGGSCGCCGLQTLTDARGRTFILYRAATAGVNRDMILLSEDAAGTIFESRIVDRWHLRTCPASTSSLAVTDNGVLMAWESQGQVRYARFEPASGKTSQLITAPGKGERRKYPVVAGNARGEVILAWTEKMRWGRPGVLRWQVFDANGDPIATAKGTAPGVPAWSLVAVYPWGEDDGFTIVY